MEREITIRTAKPEDAEALLEIYRPYVEHSAISFEWTVPDLKEFESRIRRITERYPYLVAERGGRLLGYSYTGPFIGRAAYSLAAEVTIYLSENSRGQGLGRKLYQTLEAVSRAQNITNLYACIGYPDPEDEYLTANSAQFHAHLGYRMAGRFRRCGYKFGRWYDMVWMEKLIGPHTPSAASLIPFPQVEPGILEEIGILPGL